MGESSSRTVGRVAKILEAVVAYEEPQRLVDLVRAVDAPASSVHLLLKELCRARWVQVSDDKRYAPGPGLVALALQVVSRERMVDVVAPVMSDLARDAGEDVYLAIPQDDSIVFVHRVRTDVGLRLDIQMGRPPRLHSTAVGQLFMAMVPAEVQARLLDSLQWERATDRTITDRAEFESRLAVIAKRGWAMTDREELPSVMAVAAPIFDRDRKFVASLCLSLINDQSPEHRDEIIRMLVEACDGLTAQLSN